MLECHDHKDHEVRSLNMKSTFQWTSPRQFRMQLNFLQSSGSAVEALDATGRILRSHGTLVEKHWKSTTLLCFCSFVPCVVFI